MSDHHTSGFQVGRQAIDRDGHVQRAQKLQEILLASHCLKFQAEVSEVVQVRRESKVAGQRRAAEGAFGIGKVV